MEWLEDVRETSRNDIIQGIKCHSLVDVFIQVLIKGH